VQAVISITSELMKLPNNEQNEKKNKYFATLKQNINAVGPV